MIRINSLKLNIGYTEDDIRCVILKRLMIGPNELISYKPVKISLDARKKDNIRYILCADAVVKNEKKILSNRRINDVSHVEPVIYRDPFVTGEITFTSRPVIVGAGPAGLFCALKLALAGARPLLIERGAPVDERIHDVNSFWNGGSLLTESNVQFGEGGAGTFSDGKLNTMVHDSFGRMQEVFRIFIENGADPSIAYMNKPHIGTDRLTLIVRSIRERIISLGGEVRFHTKLNDIMIADGRVKAIRLSSGEEIACEDLVLAIGHSARDTFSMLNGRQIPMERKPFAVGVRVQHPQEFIDRGRYGTGHKLLPPADYKLTYNSPTSGRGVYSFCMCPGGFVVNASSEEGMLAVNGMSNSDRSEYSANSAIVVTVGPDDFGSDSVLSGLEFQRRLEKAAYRACGGRIPAQYYCDFTGKSRNSAFTENLPNTKGAYEFGDIGSFLPGFISDHIKEAFPNFGRMIPGYDDDMALLLGLESRTSSPVRIVRGDNLQSVGVCGLYPCGEGAGYAGGITSAAMDGLRVSEAIIMKQRNR